MWRTREGSFECVVMIFKDLKFVKGKDIHLVDKI